MPHVRRLLDPSKMSFFMVGNASEIAQEDGTHDVTQAALAGGVPEKLPLLDPLTKKPMP